MTAKSRTAKLVVYILLLAGSLAFLFPFFWMLSTSLKPIEATMRIPPDWMPPWHGVAEPEKQGWQWGNYIDAIAYQSDVLGYIPFVRYARNTLYLAVLGVIGTVLANALIAYGFARIAWRGRDTLFAITLATMMIPFPIIMVPLFAIFRELGWVGSFKPLWVPAFFGSAFNIFLLRQFFMTIPRELSDAARIDGCSELGIFRNVVLPLSKPALAVVALFHFLYVWNDFLGPLIYLTDQRMFTLSLGLQVYQSQHGGTQWNMLMAASTIVVVPVIVLFFLTQRTFIQGIALTGLKG